jgi:hypothetical protein
MPAAVGSAPGWLDLHDAHGVAEPEEQRNEDDDGEEHQQSLGGGVGGPGIRGGSRSGIAVVHE